MRELLYARSRSRERDSARGHAFVLAFMVCLANWARRWDQSLRVPTRNQISQGREARHDAHLSWFTLLPLRRMCSKSVEVYGPVYSRLLRNFFSIIFMGEI